MWRQRQESLLEGNTAPHGKSMYVRGGTAAYHLPAPHKATDTHAIRVTTRLSIGEGHLISASFAVPSPKFD